MLTSDPSYSPLVRPKPGVAPTGIIGPGPTMTPMQKLAYDPGGDAGPATPPVPPHPVAAPLSPPAAPVEMLRTTDPGGVGGDGPGGIPPPAYLPPPTPTPQDTGGGVVDGNTVAQGGYVDPQGVNHPWTTQNAPEPNANGNGFVYPWQSNYVPTGSSPDLTTDPVYQKQQALDEAMMQKAASGELSQVKDLLLGYGSQTLAKSALDKLLKDPRIAALMSPEDEQQFIAALSDNPDTSTSTLAQLARKFRTQETALTENYNRDNLFYSGHHAQALGDQSYGEQSETGQARTGMLGALDRVLAAYGAAQDQAANNDLAGYQQAYDRALQEALSADTGAGTSQAPPGPSTSPTATTTGNGKSSSGNPKTTKHGKPAQAKPAVAVVRPDDRAGPRGPGPFAPPRKNKKQPAYTGRH